MIVNFKTFKFQKPFLPREDDFYNYKQHLKRNPSFNFTSNNNFLKDHVEFLYVVGVIVVLVILMTIFDADDKTIEMYVGTFLVIGFLFFTVSSITWFISTLRKASFNRNLKKIILESNNYPEFATKFQKI
jgi:hypothetical protein